MPDSDKANHPVCSDCLAVKLPSAYACKLASPCDELPKGMSFTAYEALIARKKSESD